jgi:cysteine desulfurase
MQPVYLDYNATTPVDPLVAQALLPYLNATDGAPLGHFGNPSSTHTFGRAAHEAVDKARAQLAGLIGAEPDEIVFTGGGSEASNLAIKGIAFAAMFGTQETLCAREQLGSAGFLGSLRRWFRGTRPIHIVTSVIEHPATLQPCAFLQRLGCLVTLVPVDRLGVVDVDAIRRALRTPTALVSIMHSNNEVGTIQPIAEIAELTKAAGALLHVDAAQSLGKVALSVRELDIDLLSVAGHKLYAPKGVGALFVRRGIQLESLIHGAGHECGRRAGTENVPYLVGLGRAAELAARSLPAATQKLASLRERLWAGLKAGLGERISLNGHPEQRLPNTLHVSFHDWVGAELLQATPDLAASTGSACHEGQVQLSPVLRAMGMKPEEGRGAIRLSVGRFTTTEELDRAVDSLVSQARTRSRT